MAKTLDPAVCYRAVSSRDTRFELLDEAGWNTRLRGLLQKKD